MKIKVITGFRDDQWFSVDAEEAHKAYYLFMNPEQRGVFKNGIGKIGADIRGVEPDWNGTMGWNPTHKLDDNDWNEIRSKGIDRKLQAVLGKGKDTAYLIPDNKNLLSLPLSEIELPKQIEISGEVKVLSDLMSSEVKKLTA